MGACPRWKRNPLALEKFARAFAIYQQLSTGRLLRVFTSAGSASAHTGCRPIERARADVHGGANESRRDTVFFCDQLIALFTERNNQDCVRLDLHFQPGLARDIAQRFTQRYLVERQSDSRLSWIDWRQ